jgi:hypothetical protein
VFFHLVDICLWNSNYLYNLQISKNHHLEFRRNIISYLLIIPLNQRANLTSFNQRALLHNIQKVQTRKRCRVCQANKKRAANLFICDTCKDLKINQLGNVLTLASKSIMKNNIVNFVDFYHFYCKNEKSFLFLLMYIFFKCLIETYTTYLI